MRLQRMILAMVVAAFSVQAQTWVSMGLDTLKIGHDYTSADLIFAKGSLVYAGTNKGLYRSTDGGTAWQKLTVASGLPDSIVNALAVNPQDPQILYVSIGQISATYKRSDLYKSTDKGETWKSILDSTTVSNTLIVDVKLSPVEPNIVFAVNRAPALGPGWDGVFRSRNGGSSWTYVSGSFSSSSHGVLINIGLDPSDTAKVYATGDNQFDLSFYESTDGGINWVWKSYLSGLNALQVMPDLRGTGKVHVLSSGTINSSQDGITWEQDTRLGSRNKGVYRLRQHPFNQNVFLAATGDSIWMKVGDGSEWRAVEGGPPTGRYNDLFIDSTNGAAYAGGNLGLFKVNVLTDVPGERRAIPSQFTLHQNYPNPFNPSTTIRYDLPGIATVRLAVFDILGREIAILVNEEQEAGSHVVRFNANNLQSGTYFLILYADNYRFMRKMILLR